MTPQFNDNLILQLLGCEINWDLVFSLPVAEEIIKMIVFSIPGVHPLKGLLKAHGISQAVGALTLGVSRPYLNQILSGLAPIPPQLSEKLDQLTQELQAHQAAQNEGGHDE